MGDDDSRPTAADTYAALMTIDQLWQLFCRAETAFQRTLIAARIEAKFANRQANLPLAKRAA